jgi:hypothetical protein
LNVSPEPAALAPFRSPFVVIDDFLPLDLAELLRRGIETHFETPDTHRPATHQVWNYWFVPGQYTYLRTNPEKIVPRQDIETFMAVLRGWSARTLGMNEVTWPYLSLYVNGCRQGLHNDTTNGRFAFVYSLTRNERKSMGGETLIFREGDLFRRGLAFPSAGSDFYASVEPRFNRLVVFDDRMPHAVTQLDGPMDPLEGRFVLHGHLKNTEVIVEGSLTLEAVAPAVLETMLDFSSKSMSRVRLYSGPLVLRFVITPSGEVEACSILVDRVTASDATDTGWDVLLADLLGRFERLKFPASEGRTTVTQPLIFGRA